MVLAVRGLCSQSRPWTQKSGPSSSVQRHDPIQKNSHPTEQPGKLIPPDRYGLFYQVAGSLRHSQPRGFDSDGSSASVYRRSYIAGPLLRVSCDTGGFATPGSEQDAYHTPASANKTAWSRATSKRWRSTYKKPYRTIGIGTQDCLSSSLLTGNPLTTLQALCWLA
jgi:hypothetical protein